MLEKYQEDYKEFYSILNNAIIANKLSHAYMFEVDDNINIEDFEKDICKFLILKNNRDKNIETLIDNDNYPNIKIIKADGLWIKKEQILEVQTDFKKESFDNNLKIYIIEDASKLNKSSGNTLLKFLEEPEKNIVAILLTKNKYSVITTIMSRCINISLIKKEYITLTEESLSYKAVEIIEKYKIKALPYLYQLLVTKDMERKTLLTILEKMQKIYNDILHLNNGIKEEYNYFIPDSIKNIKYESNNEQLIKKIKSIQKNSDYLRYNVNIKTILDKIIIDIYGGE
ncbi:MAG: hypothetical protein E7162_02190 [Firmicutes bacterium]|nr:hypothetical protein [Bacillota bacterium]